MEDFTFRGIPETPFREIPETIIPRYPGETLPESRRPYSESRRVFRNPGGQDFRFRVPASRNPGGQCSGIPEEANSGVSRSPESRRVFRNPGILETPESRTSLIFDLFVGCYRRAGGMKISTVVSTLFRGLLRLSEVVHNSYCSGNLEQLTMLRDNIAPGFPGALEESLMLNRAVS